MLNFTADTWIALVALLIAVGAPLAQFFFKSTAKDEADDAVATVRASVIDHDRRIIVLEERLAALPQQRDFLRLNDHLSEIAGDMKRMTAEVHALREGQARTEKAMSVIQETMMTRAL